MDDQVYPRVADSAELGGPPGFQACGTAFDEGAVGPTEPAERKGQRRRRGGVLAVVPASLASTLEDGEASINVSRET